MKNKCTLIILIFAVTLLTACGGLKTEQKAQWQEAISQIEILKNTLTENVSETKAYYDSINDEVKERMNKIDFSSFVIDEEWNDVSMPEKEKEFDAAYDILQQRILKLNTLIDSIPKIEFIKEKQHEVEKQIEAEKLKAEEEKKRLEEIEKREEQKKAQQSQETYTQITNETNQENPNQCWKSGCTLERKKYSTYCVNHSCLLCAKARYSNSAYCSSHKCQRCENVVVDGSRYCVGHKCLMCNQQKFGTSQYCSKHK